MNEGGIEFAGLGEGAENQESAAEQDEKYRQRQQATAKVMAKVKKDEKKSKNYDLVLAKLIPKLTDREMDVVIFALNYEIPSLTILAILSVLHDEAGQACYEEFHKSIEQRADFALVAFGDPAVEERVSLWWTFIVGADMTSSTARIRELNRDPVLLNQMCHYLGAILALYLEKNQITEFDQSKLEEILREYQKEHLLG